MVVACGLRSLCAAAERRSSSLCSQIQCGWLFLMDDCMTDAFRRQVPLDRWSPHQLHWPKTVNHLSSDHPRGLVDVVFTLCRVDDLRSCRRRFGLS